MYDRENEQRPNDDYRGVRLKRPLNVGLVSPSYGDWWLGGVHHIQHLVLSVALAARSDIEFTDVYWSEKPIGDPFTEIRSNLRSGIVLKLPDTMLARVARRTRNRFQAPKDASDIFRAAAIDVIFPVLPVAAATVPFVFLLPDFQHQRLPELFSPTSRQKFDRLFGDAADAATIILIASQSILEDLRHFMPQHEGKTRVVFPQSIPTADWFSLEPAVVAQRHSLPDRFFVLSNQLSKHKNHITIFEALADLRRQGHDVHVVCTGRLEDYRDPDFFPALERSVRSLGVGDLVHFLGILPRAEQIAIIRRALAVLQPSEFEGWGAAVSDAKALGKSVLASDIPVHHEHHAAGIQFLPTKDVGAWARALAESDQRHTPGPHLDDELAAAKVVQAESRRVGHEFASVLREAIDARNSQRSARRR